MWLNYFNNGLLEKGLITPQQHQKMEMQIKNPQIQSLRTLILFPSRGCIPVQSRPVLQLPCNVSSMVWGLVMEQISIWRFSLPPQAMRSSCCTSQAPFSQRSRMTICFGFAAGIRLQQEVDIQRKNQQREIDQSK